MRYLDEINAFHNSLLTNPLSSSAIALWYGLMHINNKCGWKREFNVTNMVLSINTGLSVQSLHRARNALKQAGLIDYRVRQGQQSTIYIMNYFAYQNGKQSEQASDEVTEQATDKVCEQVPDKATDKVSDDIHKTRLDKTRLDSKESKSKKTTSRFVKPTVGEVMAYCKERNNQVDANRFVDYYEANGWKIGKNSMKDWKAAIRTWERNDYNGANRQSNTDNHRTTQTAGGGKPDKWDNETDEW